MVPQQVEMQAELPENAEESSLLALLSHDPLHVDDLIRESNLETKSVIATLTMMENIVQIWYKKRLQRNPSCPSVCA